MRIVEKVKVESKQCTGIVCDRCKKEIDAEKDLFEFQEALMLSLTGGYGSVFGDGAKIELEICQGCVKEVLGPFMRISS